MTLDLFKQIAESNPTLPGWCETDKAITLASLVIAYRPDVTLEVGVFGGRSFIPIAMAHKAINHGIAIGIDPWSTEVAVSVQPTDADRKWWMALDMEQIYQGFMFRVREFQLEKFVDIRRRKSEQVTPPAAISLLHIDGGHDRTAITDTLQYAPRVKVGGFCVMDDIGLFGNSTTIAAGRLKELGFVRLYPIGTGAVFQRIR